jgi:truncated hemoglobin YjbI
MANHDESRSRLRRENNKRKPTMTDKPARPASAPKPKRASAPKKTESKASRPATTKPVKTAALKPKAVSAPNPTPAAVVSPAPRTEAAAPVRTPKTVTEQVGGAVGFAALSERLSQLLVGDPRVNHALFGTPQAELLEKVKALLATAANEVEHDLQDLFAPLREKGFKQGQFDHLLYHLKAASQQLGHPEELARTLSDATEQLRQRIFKA